MLPGVECARKRRLHQSGGGGCSSDSTTRSFCLYTRNIQSSPSSLMQRSVLNQNQSYPDEKLGGSAREAKRRLDEKFTAPAHIKSENQLYNQKRKGFFRGLWQQLRSDLC